MKAVLFAAALLVGTAAYAQDTTGTQTTGAMAGGTTVAPSNAAPKRDARGVPVISADATAPSGWNQPPGTPGAAPASASAPPMGAAGDLPPCSRKVTDHCTQTYERNHGPAGGAMAASASTGTDASATADASADAGVSAGTGSSGKKVVHHRRARRR
jgi:hypothetical protein